MFAVVTPPARALAMLGESGSIESSARTSGWIGLEPSARDLADMRMGIDDSRHDHPATGGNLRRIGRNRDIGADSDNLTILDHQRAVLDRLPRHGEDARAGEGYRLVLRGGGGRAAPDGGGDGGSDEPQRLRLRFGHEASLLCCC